MAPRRGGRADRIRVDDAARLLELARRLPRGVDAPGLDRADRWIADVATQLLGEWDRERVLLRLDGEMLGALLDTPRDSPLVPDFMERFPFGSVAVSLAQPVSLDDGERHCTYYGFIATGVRSRPNPIAVMLGRTPPPGPPGLIQTWTTYGPISEGDGVRLLWRYTDDDSGFPGAQTITPFFRVDHSTSIVPPRTIAALVDATRSSFREGGTSLGDEVDVLASASVLILLYLSSSEPDLSEVEPAQVIRPQQLERTRIFQLGWRVGSALRDWRAESDGRGESASGIGGWRLPPHIRAAHFHRVRVATRDTENSIVGDVHGEQGLDWHYEMRWYPPTPVNVGSDGPQPVVRELGAPDGSSSSSSPKAQEG